MQSEYLKSLLSQNLDVGERYKQKIQKINDVDPFTLNENELDNSIHGVPPVTNMDIVSYLVLTHSYYSKDQMKSYKSLQSYKYFESGFVTNVGTKIVNDFYIIVGKVKHSQRAGAKPLDVWCITTKDGSVCNAHCTCMAGCSEVCSHVGAILFATEYANRRREEVSCTDVLSAWRMPSTSAQVPLVPVSDMDWGKPSTSTSYKNRDVAPTSASGLKDILNNMVELGHNPAITRIIEPFATDIAKQITPILPSVLNIFNEIHTNKSYEELIKLGNTINISLTEDQISYIEETTQDQSTNHNWYIQRAGRITASKFKAVCRTNKNKPSLSLIKSICYPTKILFKNKAISWGLRHEEEAVEAYKKTMEEENHNSLIVNKVGFVVSKIYPEFGASPDRLVYCECCSGGCVEVKCPYLLHTGSFTNIEEYAALKSSCLTKENHQIQLDRSHSYYYQVQMQIFVTGLEYCDFVIWSPKIFYKERIMPDFEFWETERKVGQTFHSTVIMPELLGKFFTRKEGSAETNRWCICYGVDDGRPMIKCDGDDCTTGWFHFQCVGLSDTPNVAWFCHECI